MGLKNMKKGQKVRIYQKPLTKEDYEGEATLIRKSHIDKILNYEVWEVIFSDGTIALRTII